MLPRACLISWILLTANAATAAPIATVVELTLAIPGLGSIVVPGAGVVDVQSGQLRLPAGLLSQATSITTPVTSVTTVSALSIVGLVNRPATFRAGGITSQAPGEVCATPTIPTGSACNVGAGFGGILGLAGTLNIVIVPSVVFPLDLDSLRVGLGGSIQSGFLADAAGWSTRTGKLNLAGATSSFLPSGAGLRLVSPTFIAGGGNLLPVVATLAFPGLEVPVPEAGRLALVLGGLLGLGWLARPGRG